MKTEPKNCEAWFCNRLSTAITTTEKKYENEIDRLRAIIVSLRAQLYPYRKPRVFENMPWIDMVFNEEFKKWFARYETETKQLLEGDSK